MCSGPGSRRVAPNARDGGAGASLPRIRLTGGKPTLHTDLTRSQSLCNRLHKSKKRKIVAAWIVRIAFGLGCNTGWERVLTDRKVALITGARRGIGRAIAFALADAGFDVIGTDKVSDEDTAETAAGLAKCGSRNEFIEGDIADLGSHAALFDRIYERYERLDCVVNNAGMMCPREDILEAGVEDFDQVLGVNLRGTFFLTQAAARRMLAEDSTRTGRTIVTITSANAAMASPEKSSYCLSKSALSMAVRLFAVRLATHGIAVFEVRPGLITTEMSGEARDRYDPMMKAGLAPMKRWGKTDEVAQTVRSLATGALAYTIGQAIDVDGGMLTFRL
jgi:3-oxoacyl-[acyl-carrier protein] reductase